MAGPGEVNPLGKGPCWVRSRVNTDHGRASQNLRVGCQRNSEGTEPGPSDKVPEGRVKPIEEKML